MQKNLLFLFTAGMILLLASCTEDSSILDISNDSYPKTTELKRVCNAHGHTQKLLQNPEFRKSYENRIAAFETLKSKALVKALCGSPTIIPVAIHYQGVNNANASCLIDLAKKQVDILNADFQGINSDISKWTGNASSSFPSINFGETCVKFCIADQNHPSGYGLSDGQPAITINKTQGDQVSQWSGYLNIFVQFGTGALGYAPYGGSGNGDGVVIEATAFGANMSCGSVSPEAPYNLGRTTTHEVGHYFLLDHIWGNGCNVDDEVADTPDQAQEYDGCPNIGRNSCGSADLHMNYMDYTNDACMYMFTNGQAQRMENYLNANLGNLKSKAITVCSEASQNGDGDGGGDDNSGNCITPTDLSANTTTSTISFNWGNIEGAISYRIGIRAQGTSSWSNQNPTNSEATFNNLSSGANYEYRIRTRCSSGFTSWSSISNIQTDEDIDIGEDCDTPTGLSSNNITEYGAQLSWNPSVNVIRYQLRYRISGDSWTRKNTTSEGVSLNNLIPNTTYEYKLRARCSYGWTSYTALQTFTTVDDNTGGGDNGNSGGSSGLRVEITLDDYGSETSWYILSENDEIVAQGGPYGDFNAGRVKKKDIDLSNGCYLFVLEDFYGDGMCCDYGNGFAQIVDEYNNVIASSDGQFGFYDEIGFCLEDGSSRLGKRKKDVKSKALAKKR